MKSFYSWALCWRNTKVTWWTTNNLKKSSDISIDSNNRLKRRWVGINILPNTIVKPLSDFRYQRVWTYLTLMARVGYQEGKWSISCVVLTPGKVWRSKSSRSSLRIFWVTRTDWSDLQTWRTSSMLEPCLLSPSSDLAWWQNILLFPLFSFSYFL